MHRGYAFVKHGYPPFSLILEHLKSYHTILYLKWFRDEQIVNIAKSLIYRCEHKVSRQHKYGTISMFISG